MAFYKVKIFKNTQKSIISQSIIFVDINLSLSSKEGQ